jgi:hypothetical protein
MAVSIDGVDDEIGHLDSGFRRNDGAEWRRQLNAKPGEGTAAPAQPGN